ncbi:MAG TPA: LptE family protein [Bacteroidales bacterium]|nr:LptE family protein [Bacteroidales bacterium]
MVLNKIKHNYIRKFLLILIAAALLLFQGCKISYTFSGASTEGVSTINVIYFQNRASLVQPGLSQNLTDALIDKCRAETSLKFVKDAADVTFEGEITDYNTRPLTVGADARAATNRFSITVKVKFTNAVKPDLSYEQTFSRYADYDSNLDLSQVEAELSSDIVEMIIEDIFNQAFVNW